MKTSKLKLEGTENIKFKLFMDFDELRIVIYENSFKTKYEETLIFSPNEEDMFDRIGTSIENLYRSFLDGKEVEEKLSEALKDKLNIEINL